MNYDVIIIGFGPTGKVLARKLSDGGHRVAIVERWPAAYPLPRAVGFDHEIMRMFHALGVSAQVEAISRPMEHYVWYNADWKVLLDLNHTEDSISGGPDGFLFNQPDLERVLEADLAGRPGIALYTGHEALAVRDMGERVEVDLAPFDEAAKVRPAPAVTLSARYVVGCDGANSLVREIMGAAVRDLGFDESWLVVDVLPHDIDTLALPLAAQWCNPARPTTIISGGRTNRRWEFMLLPGETPEDFARDESVWALLAQWVTPGNSTLIRKATYRFRSLVVDGWRKGRLLVAGDAAHRMPPFMGQGMCAGLRDSWNLGWKLDRVLRGTSPEDLLDSYEAERAPHVEAVIRISVGLGKVVCLPDPEAARQRDEAFFAGQVPPPPPFPPLVCGVIDAAPQAPGAGALSPHDDLLQDAARVRLDTVAAGGFVLVSRTQVEDPRLHRLGIATVVLNGTDVRDAGGRLSAFLDRLGAAAVLIRPDFYVFGSAPSPQDIPGLLERLESRLCAPSASERAA
ncbi:bifunctional 3-(3-hydroxy-phenyl)propionate/3-hydroxycinnamic acid hydroxylase [Xanthobacter sp. AM11]|uniref:bifunctional 3-(3-hydroxy-phenyl)propionate/3-hydroxycinnamic acid hydroxylase MhpA n=1 Tax=Xanthobacter sp. AM11 TaxID=3380643 RepID=UPI0039BFE2BC